ncbi:MAG: PSD1 and planctomycete cytochrome C domain-containing protein [Planctomycetota bacterium]
MSHLMVIRKAILAIALATITCWSPWVLAGEPGDSTVDSRVIRFNEDIRPLFTKHCTACHGGVKQAADISFARPETVLPPDGWAIEPGDSAASTLIERVTTNDESIRMPPPEHGRALTADEILTLTLWIDQGAKWSRHWSFEPPVSPPVPEVETADWCRSTIDPFVLEKLEANGVVPARDEAPLRWFRRASIDVTGLPPTDDQRKRFQTLLAEKGDDAYALVVDELLQSPAFGERWASVWLDQIRYADSKGLGLDGKRNVWKYRDWVINAFNNDLPYDEFTRKQIAGDQLPGRTIEDQLATAAHRLTQTNEEGGTDDEEFRTAAVLDRVNTTWQTWMGITFGCVQCHSHPYDPIDHDEYYQFASFFNNTRDCDLNEDWPTVSVPLDPSDFDRASELDREITTLRQTLWEKDFDLLSDDKLWKPVTSLEASSSNETKLVVNEEDGRAEFKTVGTVQRGVTIGLQASVPDGLDQVTAIKLTIAPQDTETAIQDAEWGFVISEIKASLRQAGSDEPLPLDIARVLVDEPTPFYDPQLSLNTKSNRGFAGYTKIHYPRTAALVLRQPLEVSQDSTIELSLDHRVFILASFSLVSRRGWVHLSDDPSLIENEQDESLIASRRKLRELTGKRSSIRSTSVPVLDERPDHLKRPTNLFVRGLFLTKGEPVSSGTPDCLPPLKQFDSDPSTASRRELAEWLVDGNHPLTARVMVNRIWARIFGVGIVATEEDFGSSGEPPSHPELLDSLSVQFQGEFGWSMKRLIREILISRTYRQSSVTRNDLPFEDATNRLLARGPRFRLPAEIVRDQALAISGLLTSTLYGPPVYPPIPDGIWKPFQGSDKWVTPAPGEPGRYRRSIYTYVKRSIPFPMAAAFDAPSREFCTPRRLSSNTPLQALMMLNDQTLLECAEALGKQMSRVDGSVAKQIAHGFETAVCRPPSPQELDDLRDLYQTLIEQNETQPMTILASVLLNLDEVLTK